ncbi:MAG: CYTH domain-containing protein [Jaaginema sp. PMC 1079.18]|nr:CYTH domain-containing protein [Jaaginema sp. PMC 1080.18]MEC4852230.1 CYTH domain-containing protein [Jaaginema sp. PMC 1079.18]MEC4866974.1 CYTH domain-containing protein [Jaaginema sp. PMC 1078.18]
MPIEIERKFLVNSEDWRGLAQGVLYRQGYLCTEANRTVRVRVAGDRAFLTIKGKTQGHSRPEYEYTIPLPEAAAMLDTLCYRPLIEKTRYRIPIGDKVWEVDEFHGENQGLILAEVELHSEADAIDLPPWIGKEVSQDARYFNSYLARYPYASWSEN